MDTPSTPLGIYQTDVIPHLSLAYVCSLWVQHFTNTFAAFPLKSEVGYPWLLTVKVTYNLLENSRWFLGGFRWFLTILNQQQTSYQLVVPGYLGQNGGQKKFLDV